MQLNNWTFARDFISSSVVNGMDDKLNNASWSLSIRVRTRPNEMAEDVNSIWLNEQCIVKLM